jgi:hypothetical protein
MDIGVGDAGARGDRIPTRHTGGRSASLVAFLLFHFLKRSVGWTHGRGGYRHIRSYTDRDEAELCDGIVPTGCSFIVARGGEGELR